MLSSVEFPPFTFTLYQQIDRPSPLLHDVYRILWLIVSGVGLRKSCFLLDWWSGYVASFPQDSSDTSAVLPGLSPGIRLLWDISPDRVLRISS